MKSKRYLVTGATAGIGAVTAVELAKQNYDVVIVGRNEARCQATLQHMKDTGGTGDLSYLVADLSSRKDVLKLAAEYKAKFDSLDVLINNAGAVFFNDRRSADNIEMTWALNHFGYFWLTAELLDLLKQSPSARIINVSSDAHKRARLNREQCVDRVNKVPYFTYGNSKLANLLFTFELARRLEGTGIIVNALHPGVVATNFGANNGIPGRIFNLLTTFVAITCEAGARTILYLATSADVAKVTGKYFVKEKIERSSRQSQDILLAKHLWQQSEEVTRSLDSKVHA
ncbi:MAG: SDR family oxidoreductase [Candidatus Melainabacteria bacterium]|nr:SDR family oxidoreductase [Candidatus Melainabacteria bacterium]